MKITRRIMGKHACDVTRRVIKKSYSGRNKKMTKIKKRIGIMPLKKYIVTSSSLVMMQSRAKIKQLTRKLSKCSLLTQDLRHIW